ncbi:asparagine synthase-related protein [Anaeromyxobacter sp. PSR-1]|uniref:asparagine synthase-related protein n=1 Tax=Anaeromyxobacter sp. PSR-1 TaxID=1300915 RepID=UPI0005E936AA|nr:asparagine synthase-related protein [Anaeromyxobacter sp. PSR-1]GAO03339.1 asparagine synthetase [glutamine-hydrolyzing] 3 [Anaeromyxobacter sp. PSR-1]
MPGIFGFVSERPLADGAALARAMGALLSSHEGQRASAVVGPRWALGATWTPGLQQDPEPAKASGAWSVVTGEVYPSGDAATVPPASPRPAFLAALAAGDPARLARANGQFAAAAVDPASGEATLACDRYGLHALYWTQRDGLFAFASELKALLAVPGAGRALDPEGLATFLLLGEHFSDTTLLADARVAPAAALLRSSGGPPRIERWWQVRYTCAVPPDGEDEAAREAGRRFVRAVDRQTAGTPRIGIPLSGGLDSRLCMAAVPAARRDDVTTYTWGDRGCLDRAFAADAARRCGVRHVDLDYRYDALVASAARGAWITDGLAGATDFHILPFLEDLAAGSDVILNGFAGDALLGGNFHWRRVRGLSPDGLAAGTFAKRNDALPLGELDAIAHGPTREAARDLPASFAACFEAHRQEDPLGTLDAFLLDSRIRRWTSFGTQLLRARLVSRAPFYDNDFFDLVASVRPDARTEHRFYRKVLLGTFPDVARVGWQTTGFPASWPPQVFRPAGVVLRRGLGAVERLSRGRLRSPYPVARLARAFRGPLAPSIRAALFDGDGPHWEVFDRRSGERIWRELQAGADGRAKLVGVLLSLRHFLAQCRGERAAPPLSPDRVAIAAPPAALAAGATG